MESKYIQFVVGEPRPKTEAWLLLSKSHNDKLGELRYYANWRQYCFFPEEGTVWSSGCLEDVLAFVNGMKVRQETRKAASTSALKERIKNNVV